MNVDMNELVGLIRQWGVDKGLTGANGKATVEGQLDKLDEEFQELEDGVMVGDRAETIDAVGDMTVVLILLCELLEMRFEDCVQSAYNVIKNRTGKIVAGVFVKNS